MPKAACLSEWGTLQRPDPGIQVHSSSSENELSGGFEFLLLFGELFHLASQERPGFSDPSLRLCA